MPKSRDSDSADSVEMRDDPGLETGASPSTHIPLSQRPETIELTSTYISCDQLLTIRF
jgi:hypothetical protein